MSEERAMSAGRIDEGLASRLAAIEILYRVDREAAYADVLLGGRLPEFAPADRRLITRLVLGTLAWRGRLDYELERLTNRKLDGIQPAAIAIMRMGLFQLRFLDRIPQHAVVDTAVSIAKRIPEARIAAGFVNAVMRRATRETAPLPARDRNEKSFLAVAYSHPRWRTIRDRRLRFASPTMAPAFRLKNRPTSSIRSSAAGARCRIKSTAPALD